MKPLRTVGTTATAVLALGALGACGLVTTTAVAATPPAAVSQEAAAEAAEEAAYDAEEAAAAPMDQSLREMYPAFARRVEHLKALIVKVRESKEVDRQLSHKTTRYKDHLPIKREKIKTYIARIHELRMKYKEWKERAAA
jgi:CHAD domain-containing protein